MMAAYPKSEQDDLSTEQRRRILMALESIKKQAGVPIGANDLLIAAHALTLGHTVVTDNEREFSRIDDLRIENWLR